MKDMPFEDALIIKNFALGTYGFKEQALRIYNKYKDSGEYPDTLEMQYMDEVVMPLNNHSRKEVLRGKLLKLKSSNKDSIY